MANPITGKMHVGERREKRSNGDIYVYERVVLKRQMFRRPWAYTAGQLNL